MKELGCPIKFSRSDNSYVYEFPGRLKVKFEEIDDKKLNDENINDKKLDDEQLNKINGENSNCFSYGDIFCYSLAVILPCKQNEFVYRWMADTYNKV